MPTLPDWYPDPHEAKPAPAPLLLVQAFANTLDLDDGRDLLDGPDWLLAAGLVGEGENVSARDLDLTRRVRNGIRSLLELNDRPGGQAERDAPRALQPLRDLADSHRIRVAIANDGSIALRPAGDGALEDRLFALLLIVRQAQEDGTWGRLKLCANGECAWAYYDRSRNQQGSWCDMAVCGNRLKNREFRARRRR